MRRALGWLGLFVGGAFLALACGSEPTRLPVPEPVTDDVTGYPPCRVEFGVRVFCLPPRSPCPETGMGGGGASGGLGGASAEPVGAAGALVWDPCDDTIIVR